MFFTLMIVHVISTVLSKIVRIQIEDIKSVGSSTIEHF